MRPLAHGDTAPRPCSWCSSPRGCSSPRCSSRWEYDAAYGPFTQKLGLDPQGRPSAGAQFVSRAMPAGTSVRPYTGSTAVVDFWCETPFGLTGTHSDKDIPLK